MPPVTRRQKCCLQESPSQNDESEIDWDDLKRHVLDAIKSQAEFDLKKFMVEKYESLWTSLSVKTDHELLNEKAIDELKAFREAVYEKHGVLLFKKLDVAVAAVKIRDEEMKGVGRC